MIIVICFIAQELGVIEHVKEFLTSKCHNAWIQLNKLKEVQFKLQLDIDNKKDAVAIDRWNLETTKDSAGTSYMPDPLRNPKRFYAVFKQSLIAIFDSTKISAGFMFIAS
jgi:Tektin family.